MKLPPQSPSLISRSKATKKASIPQLKRPKLITPKSKPKCPSPNEEKTNASHLNDIRKKSVSKLKSFNATPAMEIRARYLRAREKAFEVGLTSKSIPTYDPLMDEFLQDYFSSPVIRKHLRRLGIIAKNGYITDERTFKWIQLALDRKQKKKECLKDRVRKEIDREVETTIRYLQESGSKNHVKKLKSKPGDNATMLNQSYNSTFSTLSNIKKTKTSSKMSQSFSQRNKSSYSPSNISKSIPLVEKKIPYQSKASVASNTPSRSSSNSLMKLIRKRNVVEKSLQTSFSLLNTFITSIPKEKKLPTKHALVKKTPIKIDSSVGTSQEFLGSEIKLTTNISKELFEKLCQLKKHFESKKYQLILDLSQKIISEVRKFPLKEIETTKLKSILCETYFLTSKAYHGLQSLDNCEKHLELASHFGENGSVLVQEIEEFRHQLKSDSNLAVNKKEKAVSSTITALGSYDTERLLMECIQKLGMDYLNELLPKISSTAKQKKNTSNSSKLNVTQEQKPKLSKVGPNSKVTSPRKASPISNKKSSKSPTTSKTSISIKQKTSVSAPNINSRTPSSMPSLTKDALPVSSKTSSSSKALDSLQHTLENLNTKEPSLSSPSQGKLTPSFNRSTTSLSFERANKESSSMIKLPVVKKNSKSLPEVSSPSEYQEDSSTLPLSQPSLTSSPTSRSKMSSISLLRLAMFKFLPRSSTSLHSVDSKSDPKKIQETSGLNSSIIAVSIPPTETDSRKSSCISEKLPLPESNYALHQTKEKKEKPPFQTKFFPSLFLLKPEKKIEIEIEETKEQEPGVILDPNGSTMKVEDSPNEDEEKGILPLPVSNLTSSNSLSQKRPPPLSSELSIPTSVQKASIPT